MQRFRCSEIIGLYLVPFVLELFAGTHFGSSSYSVSIRHSFTLEDLVSVPNLELLWAVILHNCASDYIQTVLVV